MSPSLSIILPLIFLLFGGRISGSATITVGAASDLAPLQAELADSFAKAHPGLTVRFVSGASGVLAQQIENGAPYDVFLSANAEFVDRLSAARKLEPSSVTTYAIGRVGVLWGDHKPHSIRDLGQNSIRIIALPNPQLAPYGAAAKQGLVHAGIWEAIRPKVVFGENVRQALQIFDSGNADAVLTAASLLGGRSPDLMPEDWHSPIIQKAGVVAASENPGAARTFLQFLNSPAGQAVFARHGFGGRAK